FLTTKEPDTATTCRHLRHGLPRTVVLLLTTGAAPCRAAPVVSPSLLVFWGHRTSDLSARLARGPRPRCEDVARGLQAGPLPTPTEVGPRVEVIDLPVGAADEEGEPTGGISHPAGRPPGRHPRRQGRHTPPRGPCVGGRVVVGVEHGAARRGSEHEGV